MNNEEYLSDIKDTRNYAWSLPNHDNRYQQKEPLKTPRAILIKDCAYIISTNNDNQVEVLKNKSVLIEGAFIKAVFDSKKENISYKGRDLIYDASIRGGIVLTPGFINAHAHPTMYLMRSAMLLDYGQYLDETIAKMPFWQKHIKEKALVISILGDLTEQQKSGITTTLNHNAIYKQVDQVADICYQRIINCVSAVSNSQPDMTLDKALEYIQSEKRSLSSPGIALHYLFKVDEGLLKKLKKVQDKHGALLTIHFAESAGVVQKTVEKFGLRETVLLQKHGLLNSLTLLSHVLHVTEEEIEQLVKAKTGVVHLPTSNAIHKSGVFNYPAFARYGGADYIALGTDSVVSKNRLDLLSEAFQTRITHLPEYTVYYEELFKMMTTNGARVLNQPHLGKIAPGYKADIAFWKLKDRGFLPFDENDPKTLVGNIISHGGRNIRDLMIDGTFVISNRIHNFVDESKLLVEIQTQHMEVRRKVEKETEQISVHG